VRTTRGGSDTLAPAEKTRRKAGKRKATINDDVDEEIYQTQEPKMANEDTDTDPDVTHTPDQHTSENETDDGEDSATGPQSSRPQAPSQAKAQSPLPSAKKVTTRTSAPRKPADDESSDSGFEAAAASQSQPSRVKASQASQPKQKTPPELPPKRELPFSKGRQLSNAAITPATTTKKKPAPVIDDDETDDEL